MKANRITLTQYSALSGTLLISAAMPGGGGGGVHYTDIDPDVIITNPAPEYGFTTYYLDIDGDGDGDYIFKAGYQTDTTAWAYETVILNTIRVGMPGPDAIQSNHAYRDYIGIFPLGDEINDEMEWLDAGVFTESIYLVYNQIGGSGLVPFEAIDWLGANYKYAPIRIKSGGEFYHGWIRLSVSETGNQVILHDYAIHTTPDIPILAGETGFCDHPIIYKTSNITSASARITWAPVLDATKYQIRYRPIGGVSWTSVNAIPTSTSKKIMSLSCDTEYEVKIRAQCSGEFSDFSPLINFTTASCRLFEDAVDKIQLRIFPNPAANIIYANIREFDTDEIRAEIYNMYGERVSAENYLTDEVLEIDISELPSGNYILKINSETKTATHKIVIQ